MSAAVLIERLARHGVTFARQPIRAHCQTHGGERDTFLVADGMNPLIEAKYGNRVYCEVGIEPETGCRKLAKRTVYVTESDNFSGYGIGMWLSSRPLKDAWGKDRECLFVMEMPARIRSSISPSVAKESGEP